MKNYTILNRWGNSLGIRIPKNIIDLLGIKEGDALEIALDEKKIILTKKQPVKFDSLKNRLEFFYGASLDKIQPEYCEEVEFGIPVGKELF